MILSSNKNNINIAYSNQKKYNNLSKEEKDKWIYNIYNFYNNSIPVIYYSIEDILYKKERTGYKKERTGKKESFFLLLK